ncbi:MAG: hypothetical protein IPG45_13205 [Deltaproteobacteria bacterium]|nr:hypothetical protein [Deltaproteobacteria bacterium]
MRNFHVEHYRPKSRFAALANDYDNLFFACGICNVFKGDDWPGDPDPSNNAIAYPKPSNVDYNSLFSVDDGGAVSGRNPAAVYLIERVHLNRAQLIVSRRFEKALEELSAFLDWVHAFRPQYQGREGDLERLLHLVVQLAQYQVRITQARPYGPADQR